MRSNLFISCSLPSLGIQCRYISVILCGRVASSSDGGKNQANVIVYGQSGKKTPITVIKITQPAPSSEKRAKDEFG